MTFDLPDSPDAIVDLFRTRSIDGSPFARFLAIDLVAAFDGRAELTLEPRPELSQHRGTIHGGVRS